MWLLPMSATIRFRPGTAEPDRRRSRRARTRGRGPEQPPADKQKPAVNPKRSVHDDYIVCLEDGKKFKSLKRHLMTHYGLTPDQYREKWGLDASYPMVAPNYAAARSQLAKKMGLGRKRKTTLIERSISCSNRRRR